MVDKNYCLSSFLAFRHVFNDEKDFVDGLNRQRYVPIQNDAKTLVSNAVETDLAIKNVFRLVRNEKLGLLLSGGMDSAILASYMPEGSDAYTFRFLGGEFQKEELERANQFAQYYRLNLHYIEINWDIVERSLPAVMRHKGAPVHSIEPQIYYAAQQAKRDGISMMVIGDGADYVFGGMDGLLSRDWSFDQFVKRSMYVDPNEVLVSPVDVMDVYERYRIGSNSIDYLGFYGGPITDESYASYENAFESAEMPFIDPYDHLKLSCPLDIDRIRNGESKYVIRELFRMKYPHLPVPQKNPMPRPVDRYFSNWKGPSRPEFRCDIPMDRLSGNQKWLIWCAERFLNMFAKDAE